MLEFERSWCLHLQETEHLIRLVHDFGMGNWAAMLKEGVSGEDTIKRRNQVRLRRVRVVQVLVSEANLAAILEKGVI